MEFYWHNTESNELWSHTDPPVIVAQVFKHEYDPIEKVQTWRLVLPWRETYMVFNKRVNAKKWALSEARDYCDRWASDKGWEPGKSPEEARRAVAERLAKREAEALRKATGARHVTVTHETRLADGTLRTDAQGDA